MNKQNLPNNKRKLFYSLSCLVVLIAIMIFTGVGASLWGVELHGIEEQIAESEAVNERLEDEIIKHTSLTATYQNAESMGFARAESVVYLNNEATELGYAKP